MTLDPRLLNSLAWRCVGPHRGGRVVAVAGHPSEAMTFYFGACAGGVWKTTDGGTYWENVSDGFFETAAVGALAVAASDPNVVYAGTGEACIRGNVSHGDGVYRSTDGGRTWANVGLARHASHRARPGPPARPRPRVRGGARPRLGSQPRARRLSVAERRRHLGAGAVPERAGRRRRPLHGPAEPAHPLRGSLGGAAHAVEHDQRRCGLVAVEVDRRGRHVDRHLAQPGAAARRARTDRGRRLPGGRPAGLRRDRGRGRRAVPLRRRGRHLAARERGGGPPRAPLVLHARLRRPDGRGDRVGGGLFPLEVDRRRPDVRRGGDAARRQPRPLDRSRRTPGG